MRPIVMAAVAALALAACGGADPEPSGACAEALAACNCDPPGSAARNNGGDVTTAWCYPAGAPAVLCPRGAAYDACFVPPAPRG